MVGALSFVNAAGEARGATERVEVPPILLDGEDGRIRLRLDLGFFASLGSVAASGSFTTKICDGTDCENYTLNYVLPSVDSPAESQMSIWEISIGERFGKRQVTAQVPTDLRDGSNGWSTTSNAVTGWVDPADWFKSRANRPPLEFHFKSLDPTSISRVDVCANYNEGQTLTKNMSGYTAFSLEGYTSITSVLLENGVQIRAEDMSSALQSAPPVPAMTDIPLCGGGIMGSNLMKTIEGLTAGRSYTLTYTVSGAGKPTVTARLDFITPGACPSGEISLPPAPRTYYFGVVGTDGVLTAYFTDANYQWRIQSALTQRLAPIYFSSSKVKPYNGDIYRIRGKAEKWRYLRDIDDWALVVDNAGPITASSLLAYTVFAQCNQSNLKTVLSLDETSVKAADQGCVIDSGRVVPVKVGQCNVKASVSGYGVTSAGVRRTAGSATVAMNYFFSSVQTQETADQNRAVLLVNTDTSSSTSSTASNYVRTVARGVKATITITLTKAQTVKVWRKVGNRSTLLKTIRAKAGKNTYITPYKKTYVFVVKDAKGKTIAPRVSSKNIRSGPLFLS